MFRNISRTVWIISLVSLLNDFSSEMLYPIIPLYLQQIGYGSILIGLLEGVAEFTAGLTKIYAGSLSDSFQRRLPFVNIGYSLSVLSRPLIAVSSSFLFIFTGRSLDRIGKGIRTGARDALLAEECNDGNRAEVFGFHRSMDTLGAVLGPILAILYLSFRPADYRMIFFITLVPGILAIIATFFIQEKENPKVVQKDYSIRKHFTFYKEAPKIYLKLLLILLCFSLINSSDMFLLLRAKNSGMTERNVLILYILFNLCYTLFAFPIGKLADRLGKKKMLAFGFLIYAMTYIGFASSMNTLIIVGGFISYGLFYAFTQGTTKAILIESALPSQKSSAIGFYEGLNSISLLLANSLAGFIWYKFGAETMLYITGLAALMIGIYLMIVNISTQKPQDLNG